MLLNLFYEFLSNLFCQLIIIILKQLYNFSTLHSATLYVLLFN